MRTTYGAFAALALLGGYLAWRNRFAIQRQLEAWGIRTPTLEGGFGEKVGSMASQATGRVQDVMDRGKEAVQGQNPNIASNY